MITKPTPRNTLKEMFIEMLIATSGGKLTKVTAGSILNGTAHGVARISQGIIKDISILEGNLFKEAGFGTQLDNIAERDGQPARFSQSPATTYVRLVGDVGTIYQAGVHNITGTHGVIFELEQDVTIGSVGFAYAKVRAQSQGADTNVDPLTLNRFTPSAPLGHIFVTNEYVAQGGRNNELDEQFRERLKQGVNVLSRGTLSSYEQVFAQVNNNVLRLFKGGTSGTGQFQIYIATVNGVDLTPAELQEISDESEEYLSLTDSTAGLELLNIPYYPIDISLRVELEGGAIADDVRIQMMVAMQKIIDWRFWEFGDVVEFEDILIVAKQTLGVKRVLENFASPSSDITPPSFTLPRIRSFTLYDPNGVIISDSTGVLTPAFFPFQDDFLYQQTLYSSL